MEKKVKKTSPVVILLHCHAVVMPDDSFLFLEKFPSTPGKTSSSLYPCYVFMCKRRTSRRRKTFLLLLCRVEKNDLCFGDDNLEQRSHLNSPRTPIIVADYCCSLTFSNIKYKCLFVLFSIDELAGE